MPCTLQVMASIHTGTALQLALADIDKAPKAMRPALDLERRYILYKLNRLDEAAAGIDDSADPALRMLLAQIRYRLGDFTAAADAFRSLLSSCADDQRSVLAANLLACIVSSAPDAADAARTALRDCGVDANESSEIAFNLACALLRSGRLEDCLRALDAAHTMGEEALVEVRGSDRIQIM